MEAYFDNSATTRCYPEVAEIVVKTMTEDFGNPSAMHMVGVKAEKYIKEAQENIAKILKVDPKEIFFTSGGTESDNWAIKAAAQMLKEKGRVGMVNTCLRIRMMTEDTAQFSVESEPGIGTLVSIRFPLNKAIRAE